MSRKRMYSDEERTQRAQAAQKRYRDAEQADPERRVKRNARQANRSQRARRENSIFLDELKTQVGCFFCGFHKWAESLDFHHLFDKRFEIGSQKHRSETALLAEAAKCVVLCSNCHARLHRVSVRKHREIL